MQRLAIVVAVMLGLVAGALAAIVTPSRAQETSLENRVRLLEERAVALEERMTGTERRLAEFEGRLAAAEAALGLTPTPAAPASTPDPNLPPAPTATATPSPPPTPTPAPEPVRRTLIPPTTIRENSAGVAAVWQIWEQQLFTPGEDEAPLDPFTGTIEICATASNGGLLVVRFDSGGEIEFRASGCRRVDLEDTRELRFFPTRGVWVIQVDQIREG
jgi:hypothetical protein